MNPGVCRNAACAKSVSGELIERYPGPGEFCPDCGEPLQTPVPAAERVATAEPAPAEPPPDSFAQFREDLQSALADRSVAAADADASAKRKLPLLAVIAVAAALAIALIALRPAMTLSSKTPPLRICGSSMTTRVAGDIVSAYAAKNGAAVPGEPLTSGGPCDVQFAVSARSGGGAEIARDGIVAIVHPHNPITRMSDAQLRGIINGSITDWSQLGGPRGTIFVVLPSEGTDERRAIQSTLLRGVHVASRVLHVGSSGDIVRLVSGASGRRWLGIVAFSAAVPAKVVPLGSGPIPSAVTIANRRYPLTMAVTVSAGDSRNTAANSLVSYARSADAEPIVTRDGFVAKNGY